MYIEKSVVGKATGIFRFPANGKYHAKAQPKVDLKYLGFLAVVLEL